MSTGGFGYQEASRLQCIYFFLKFSEIDILHLHDNLISNLIAFHMV